MTLAKERLKVSTRPWDLVSEDDICYTGMRKERKEKGGSIPCISFILYATGSMFAREWNINRGLGESSIGEHHQGSTEL